jgi:hypothetical protein
MILIDADILVYRIAFGNEDDSIDYAKKNMDNLIAEILVGVGSDADSYQLYLTGGGNFRKELATIQPYKGTRKSEKPKHYQALRDYLVDHWNAKVIQGMEADDALAMEGTRLGDEAVIVSIDKDLLQVKGRHYNFNTKQMVVIDEFTGMYNLYHQLLTGDRVDNIRGVQGIGKVKATKLLKDCETEYEMFTTVLKAYGNNLDELIENARLLYLLRYEDDWWHPPKERKGEGS